MNITLTPERWEIEDEDADTNRTACVTVAGAFRGWTVLCDDEHREWAHTAWVTKSLPRAFEIATAWVMHGEFVATEDELPGKEEPTDE